MEEHTPAFRPLDGIPVRDRRRWCLAMAHGFFYEDRRQAERSSPIFADEIRDTGWDYVALGHQHVQTNVSQGAVAAHYSGAPVAEWGGSEPGAPVLRVELSEQHGVRVEPRAIF
jgi:DNA repair exonuclease SbcCD nuclease subunit